MNNKNGNLVIGQSGGPTAVINASLAGILGEIHKVRAFKKVFGMQNGIEGALKGNLINLTHSSVSFINNLKHTPGAILGSCRKKIIDSDIDRLLTIFKKADIHCLLYIGGNDSMDTCHRINESAKLKGYDLIVNGIPKTIDNDLAGTDHCPGFGSAARFIAQTVRDANQDLISLQSFLPVVVFEVMGRNSGWLAASAILGRVTKNRAPHLICVPEKPFREDQFLLSVKEFYKEYGYVSIVVSEGIRDENGLLIGEKGNTPIDPFGHRVVGLINGAGTYLAELVVSNLGLKTRCNQAGTIQRSSTAHLSNVDIEEAVMVGCEAVKLSVNNISDYMITINRVSNHPYKSTTGNIPLSKVANVERRLSDNFISAIGDDITNDFVEYARPLIGQPFDDFAIL